MAGKRLFPFGVFVLLALLLSVSPAAACWLPPDPCPPTIIVVEDNGNSVSIDSVAHNQDPAYWSVGISETFVGMASVWIEFDRGMCTPWGPLHITKSVTNDTDTTWEDFHMKLWVPRYCGDGWKPSPNDDGLYFSAVWDTGPFGQSWFDPNGVDEIRLWDGTWAPGETYALSFAITGWSRCGNHESQITYAPCIRGI